MVPFGVLAELGHPAEDRDEATAGAALCQVPERRLHRGRVRVVGVVDDEAAARQRQLLSPPRRQQHCRGALGQALERQAESLVRRHRRERILRLVARREREPDAAAAEGDVCAVLAQLDVDRPDPAHVDVVAQVRLQVGRLRHDRDPTRGKSGDQLRLRPRDAVDRSDELEVHGPDRGDHADVRTGDLAELRDLAEAAHAHLHDADLRVRLEPAERERNAELGVVAALGRDRARDRRAERREDVLRRRLAGGAGDADEPSAAGWREAPRRGSPSPRTRRSGRASSRLDRALRRRTRVRREWRRRDRRAERGESRSGGR